MKKKIFHKQLRSAKVQAAGGSFEVDASGYAVVDEDMAKSMCESVGFILVGDVGSPAPAKAEEPKVEKKPAKKKPSKKKSKAD
jgi:hypothetical protein